MSDDDTETVKISMSVSIPRTYELTVEVDRVGHDHEIVRVEPKPFQSEVTPRDVYESLPAEGFDILHDRVDEAIEEADDE